MNDCEVGLRKRYRSQNKTADAKGSASENILEQLATPLYIDEVYVTDNAMISHHLTFVSWLIHEAQFPKPRLC